MKINARVFRYIIIIFSIIIATYAIQVFVQNFNIENEIKQLKQTQKTLSGDTYWTKHYYEPFLKTEYAKIYFAHRAGLIGKNEKLYKIVSFEKDIKTIENTDRNIYNETTSSKTSCKGFFIKLKKKYFTN